MVLFINACVRKESRTKLLVDYLISKINKPYKELRLNEINFSKVDEDFIKKRDNLLIKGEFDNPVFDFAREFAKASEIVIAAPFWDLSFPAALKQYFEQINVVGITFRYTIEGIPEGLCKAEKLTYITTAGGNFFPEEYGFGYIKALAQNFYGIKNVNLIKATGLDIDGANEKEIIKNAREKYNI